MPFFTRVFSLFPLICSLSFWWGTKQKMARSVNKAQTDILLNKMQSNRSVACGFVKLSKEVVADFWKSLTEDLNSAGPPVKNVTEWKKVWTDQKRYVRSKAAANLKNMKATGGGPNQTKCLSASEQFIYELVGMKESVEGLDNSLIFGLPECSRASEKQNEPLHERNVHDDEVMASKESITAEQMTPSRQDTSVTEDSAEKVPYSLKRKRSEPQEKLSTADLIAKEVKTQESIYTKIAEIADSSQVHNKEMETIMRRVYRSLEKSNDLKSKELKMLERHHAVCEELRLKEVESKIEKNKRLLEIEEIKLQILKENASK